MNLEELEEPAKKRYVIYGHEYNTDGWNKFNERNLLSESHIVGNLQRACMFHKWYQIVDLENGNKVIKEYIERE